jgi:hypothetical protein
LKGEHLASRTPPHVKALPRNDHGDGTTGGDDTVPTPVPYLKLTDKGYQHGKVVLLCRAVDHHLGSIAQLRHARSTGLGIPAVRMKVVSVTLHREPVRCEKDG